MTSSCTSSSSSKFFPARCFFRWRNKWKSLGCHKQQQSVCEFPLNLHFLRCEIVWRNAPRIWRDFGSALLFQTRLTQTKPVLPLSNDHGLQVKDQGQRQCCHNKHKKFPYQPTRDVTLLSGHASYIEICLRFCSIIPKSLDNYRYRTLRDIWNIFYVKDNFYTAPVLVGTSQSIERLGQGIGRSSVQIPGRTRSFYLLWTSVLTLVPTEGAEFSSPRSISAEG
jgi:hypothetical protein